MSTPKKLTGRLVCLTLLLFLSTAVYADGHEHQHNHEHEHNHEAHAATIVNDEGTYYFSYPKYRGLMYAHILTMCAGWIIFMPVSCVLLISNSRYHLPAKLLFLVTHGVSIFLGFIYDKATPDLYPNNSYRKLEWAIICILLVQSVLGVLRVIVRTVLPENRHLMGSKEGFTPIREDDPECRPSGDSGQGTEDYYPSRASVYGDRDNQLQEFDGDEPYIVPTQVERVGYFAKTTERIESFLSRRMPFVFNERVMRVCGFCYDYIERFLVILGYVQICLGIVTGSGIFMGNRVFNGLAHFIKGSIFFLYGIITLGRWLGAFSELGWAWNVKPSLREFGGGWARKYVPSAEMIESTTIFVYGCSNIFLERLAGAGGAWSHGDLEHVSIAFMFIGGGLSGILFESKKIRDLLNYSTVTQVTTPSNSPTISTPGHQVPKNYGMSYNPIPALVFFILGVMMSKHHQALPLSTTLHTQWGTLLSGFSVFRLLTYALLYLSPPISYLPSRPPTEIVGSFCLMAGGLVFMASNKDTASYLDRVSADPMFILTVIIGIAALIMCWVTGVMAIKGWALRREHRKS
ncbi:hypothetical protein P167DRAFT_483155 [Morchella conica CCBAS932]|uniref:Integral membrane protein n=1 Tax=Morchella conica CCBAS932 TaxID=1392247 RepID=A0A3N4L3H9_9PEZI|nr:hypothetical protein P167DRAFT_483155 [Morchella conica CCBAS932]